MFSATKIPIFISPVANWSWGTTIYYCKLRGKYSFSLWICSYIKIRSLISKAKLWPTGKYTWEKYSYYCKRFYSVAIETSTAWSFFYVNSIEEEIRKTLFIIQDQENIAFLFGLVENRKHIFSKQCSYFKYFVTETFGLKCSEFWESASSTLIASRIL